MIRYFRFAILVSACLLLTACTVVSHSGSPRLATPAIWGVLPFINHTEVPFAANRAQSITTAVLRSRGLRSLVSYRISQPNRTLLPDIKQRWTMQKARAWAKRNHVRYALTGDVNEWRYKVGLDGEPVVGVNLRLLDMSDGYVVWSAVGSKSGSSRKAVTTVAQQLIIQLLKSLPI